MSAVKCFDVVSEVVAEASQRFEPMWRIHRESHQILIQYCSVIDSLVEEFEGISFEVWIDDVYMTINIVLECIDIEVCSEKHNFYSLAQRSVGFGFSVSKDGNLNIKFVFPSIWERAII